MLLAGFIFAQIIIFAVILFILKRILFHDTASHVNRLAKLDDLNRQKERDLAKRLEEVETLLTQKKAELEKEETRMRQEAERSAAQFYDDMVKKAKVEAEEVIKKAFAARDKMKTDAIIEAESRIAEFCLDLISKVIAPLMMRGIDAELVKEFLAELEKTDMTIVAKSVDDVELVSARKLEDDQVASVEKTLSKKLGRAVQVKRLEEPALIGGVRIKLGSLVLNGSLAEHLKEATAQLKESVAWKHKLS